MVLNPTSGIDRRAMLSALATAPAMAASLLPTSAPAQTAVTNGGFSFAACGDSRPIMYLPYKDGHPDLVRLFVEMFGLVMPERVAEEVVKRDVKMIFDPGTKELAQVIMPFMTRSEVMTLSVDQGWVTRATVEDGSCCRASIGKCSSCRAANGWRGRSSSTSRPGAPNS